VYGYVVYFALLYAQTCQKNKKKHSHACLYLTENGKLKSSDFTLHCLLILSSLSRQFKLIQTIRTIKSCSLTVMYRQLET